MSKVVLITGAAHGIGEELAKFYSSSGYSLCLIDLDKDKLLELVNSLDVDERSVHYKIADISKNSTIKTFIQESVQQFGKIDLVFVNAGINFTEDESFLHLEIGRSIFETNFFAAAETIIESTKFMRKGVNGRIIVITSISSLVSSPNSGWYSASKTALSKYIDSVRIMTAKDNISICEIVLGFVDTRMNEGLKHGGRIKISTSRAVKNITRVASSNSRKRSIPFLRNSIWYFLMFVPTKIRVRIFRTFFKVIYGRQI